MSLLPLKRLQNHIFNYSEAKNPKHYPNETETIGLVSELLKLKKNLSQ